MNIWGFIKNNYSRIQTIELWNNYCKAIGRIDIIYKLEDINLTPIDRLEYYNPTDKYFARTYNSVIYTYATAIKAIENVINIKHLSDYCKNHPCDDKMKKYIEENS